MLRKNEIGHRRQKLLWCLVFAVLHALTGGVASADGMGPSNTKDAIIFIRHALAPGGGDPAEFDVKVCSTQRNLSQQGRQQARDIGRKLRSLGFADTPIYTSEWCRCRETADLMDVGPVENQPLLNSFFGTPSAGPAQLHKLTQWLSAVDGPVVLVTHQVVITGMTDVYPSSGEMVVTSFNSVGELSVVSTVETEIR